MKPKISALPDRLNTVPRPVMLMLLGIVAVIVTFFFWLNLPAEIHTEFTDRFDSLSDTAMQRRGWLILNKDSVYWSKRNDGAQGLRLFTLPPSTGSGPFRDLLLRPLPYDCFSAEAQLDPSLPAEKGLSAGIVLLQDRTLQGKRLELALSPDSTGRGVPGGEQPGLRCSWNHEEWPEDTSALALAEDTHPSVIAAGQSIVLRVEKSRQRFTLQYALLSGRTRRFRTLVVRKLAFSPRFVGLFAVGRAGAESPSAVYFRYFRLSGKPCDY